MIYPNPIREYDNVHGEPPKELTRYLFLAQARFGRKTHNALITVPADCWAHAEALARSIIERQWSECAGYYRHSLQPIASDPKDWVEWVE